MDAIFGDSSEVEHLKANVDKLTKLLHTYQDKYPPITEHGEDIAQIVPPWSIDERLVSPLFKEYEAQINFQTGEAQRYMQLYKEASKDLSELVEENTRLSSQLQTTLSSQVDQDYFAGPSSVNMGDDPDMSALENLQQQLRLVSQDRDRYSDIVRASKHEIERLEDELNDLRRSHISSAHWNRLQLEHEQVKQKFGESMEKLHTQVLEYENKCETYRIRYESSEQRLGELMKQINKQHTDIKYQEKTKSLQVDETIRLLESQLDGKSSEITSLRIEIDSLNDLVEAQMEQLRILSIKIPEKDHKIQDVTGRMQGMMETAENAVLERDEMALSVKNYQGEVDRLREELSTLCDEAGKKTSEEVEKMNKYHQQKINKLEDAIHSLQLENGTTNAELDRCIAEKRSVEDELSKIYQQGADQAYQDGGRFDKLNRRACSAESDRDDLKMKLSLLEAEMKKTEMSTANEKLTLTRKLDSLEERLLSLQKDFNNVNEDRLRHLEECKLAQDETTRVRLEMEDTVRKYNKQITCMEYSLKLKQSEYENKMRGLEDSHQSTINKLRSEINRQQRSDTRWKEEYDSLLSKMDKTTNTLRLDIKDKDARIQELSNMLNEARDRTISAEEMMRDCTNQMKKVEMRTKNSEMKLSDALTQLARKESKIRQLMSHHREFQSKLGISQSGKDLVYADGTFRLSDMHEPTTPRSSTVLDSVPVNTLHHRSYDENLH